MTRHIVKYKSKQYEYERIRINIISKYASLFKWIVDNAGKKKSDIVHEMLLMYFSKLCMEKYNDAEQCNNILIKILGGDKVG